MPNTAPVLTGLAVTLGMSEDTVNSAPQFIAPSVTVNDAENNFFNIGTNTPGYVTVTGLLAGDIVGIYNSGTGPGQIGVSGDNITYNGSLFAVFTGGQSSDLTVLLLPTATSAAITALIQNLTFQTLSNTPVESRSLTITVYDDQGAASRGPLKYSGLSVDGLNNFGNPADVGNDSAPALADLDGDGDLDMISGSFGGLTYYENKGTAVEPLYRTVAAADNPVSGLSQTLTNVTGYLKTTFADLDADGDQDLIVGHGNGQVTYLKNTGTANNAVFVEQTGAANPLGFIGTEPVPPRNVQMAFADMDNDGDLDAFAGNRDGNFRYYKNTGSTTAPTFVLQSAANNPLNGVSVGLNSTITLGDIDLDGDNDAIIGANDGKVRLFLNTGSATAAAFTQMTGTGTPLLNFDAGDNSTVALADIDNDSDLDLVIGMNSGQFKVFRSDFLDTIKVSVYASNDAPVITSDGGANGFVAINENTTDVTFVTAVDPDPLGSLYYSIVGGADAGKFFIDGDTGYLGFAAAPDHDVAGDANGDNDYEVIIQVSDQDPAYGAAVSTQTLTVRVADIPGPLIWGGTGDDIVDATHAPLGMDFATAENDVIFGWLGNDKLSGLGGPDEIHGDEGNDIIEGGAGADILDGGTETDTLSYRFSTQGVFVSLWDGKALYGDAAGDTISNFENLTGSANYDLLAGDENANVLSGLGTYDEIYGRGGDDTINGGDGGDYMDGGDGLNDTLSYAGSAAVNASLTTGITTGGQGVGDTFLDFESIFGSGFGDTLQGDAGKNTLSGAGGDDTLRGMAGADVLNGGAGNDTASYLGSAAVTVNLGLGTASGSHATGDTFASIENLTGSNQNDSLTGSAGANILNGLQGNDRLDGAAALDTIITGAGIDTIVLTRAATSADIITDFATGIDKLEISAALFGAGLAAGALDPQAFLATSTGVAAGAEDRFIYDTDDGRLYFDSNGSAANGSRLIATFTNLVVLASTDFVIV